MGDRKTLEVFKTKERDDLQLVLCQTNIKKIDNAKIDQKQTLKNKT